MSGRIRNSGPFFRRPVCFSLAGPKGSPFPLGPFPLAPRGLHFAFRPQPGQGPCKKRGPVWIPSAKSGALRPVTGELGHIQGVIGALLFQKLLMVPRFHHPPVVHDHDHVRVLDGGKPVGDNEAGTVFHKPDQGVLDALLGTGIHRGGGFIQNEDLGIGQNGPGNVQQLPLAVG